jgi:transposase
MAQIVCPLVSAAERARLEAIVADRNRAQKHVARARIILGSAARLSVAEVARRASVGRPAVWRWQERFAEAGVDGLLRDATRKPGKAPLAEATVHRVVTLTCAEPPGAATYWTGRAMAKTAGISLRSVQRIWAAHDLQPHRIRTFKRSNDPDFAAKLEDIVGLYMAPPKHAIVLSVDEKSQIQALDRTQPGLPLKPGKAGTMSHDYKRHGTTTLFAALDVLEGTVISRCMQRHRHQEFIRFLNAVERAVPAGKVVHAILDNYAAHKHPKVLAWLGRHRRWTFHFTPTSGSWLNAVETFFSALTRRRIRRGSFRSIVDLQTAINRYIVEHNHDPKPFTWTKPADQILAKVNRLNASVHYVGEHARPIMRVFAQKLIHQTQGDGHTLFVSIVESKAQSE